MDTLFIQFYSEFDHESYELQNGFSDTYDFCKNKGDFLWIYQDKNLKVKNYQDHNGRSYRHSQNVESIESTLDELPITKGTVYVSASYFSHLYKSYLWAREYPNIEFIVGGPVVTSEIFYIDPEDKPKNLTLIATSVEEHFGLSDFSYPWKIDIPEDIPDDACVMFVYTINSFCYWRKCIFCSNAKDDICKNRHRTKLNYEFKDIERERLLVRLGTEAFSPRMINTISPPRQDNIIYKTFVRPCRGELEALKKLDSVPDIWFTIGLEYPTNRMWNYMGKGFNHIDVLDFIRFSTSNDIRLTFSTMLGWSNLEETDVLALENFMSMLPNLIGNTVIIHKLITTVNTKLYHDDNGMTPVKYGPFLYGYYPDEILRKDREQLDLNLRSKEIIKKYSEQKGMRVIDTCSLEVDVKRI